jgi:FAD:protein FMN transferase
MRACAPAGTRWEALGTSVVLRVADASALAPARAALERELAAIDGACSRFRGDSELSRLNALAGRATSVGPLLLEAVSLALQAAELTGGDLDPTVGVALELAGYDRDWRLLEPAGRDDRDDHHPAASARVHAKVLSDWRAVSLDRERRSIRVPAGMKLDLGATAKALAADRGAAACAAAAGCGALVSLGGDIATSGPAPAGGWAVHVTDDHRSAPSAPGQRISIAAGGLATSSTAVRRWRHENRAMHHIIDPATSRPALSPWRTVSVAAASCAEANIAATTAIIRGMPALAWLAELELPARLVARDGNVSRVTGWPSPAGEHTEDARGARVQAQVAA